MLIRLTLKMKGKLRNKNFEIMYNHWLFRQNLYIQYK